MDIFVILYLLVIIAALVLILVLATKKEGFSESTPFELRCRNKEVESTQPLPVLYYYYANQTCAPSNKFMNDILTRTNLDRFDNVKYIDLNGYDASNPPRYYDKTAGLTPTIIVEYPYIINDTIKQKILNLENSDRGIKVEHIDGSKHIIVISNLDEYTPDDSDSSTIRQNKQDSFNEFINKMSITS